MEVPPVTPRIQYASQPPGSSRPDIVTAIGVISVVFSIWTGLMAVMTGMQVGMFSLMRQTNSASPVAVPVVVGPATLPASRASELADWIAAQAQLDPTMRSLVEQTLADDGAHIFPDHAAILSPADLQQRISVAVDPASKSVSLTTASATMRVEPGSIAVTIQNGQTTTSITRQSAGGVSSRSATTSRMQVQLPSIGVTPLVLLAIDGVLSMGAAMLLLVSGIRTLQSRKSGRRLHLIWAVIKVVLALFSGVVVAVVATSMMSWMGSMVPAGSPPLQLGWLGVLQAVLQVGLSMIYPVAVLIVLNLKSVRTWFRDHGR